MKAVLLQSKAKREFGTHEQIASSLLFERDLDALLWIFISISFQEESRFLQLRCYESLPLHVGEKQPNQRRPCWNQECSNYLAFIHMIEMQLMALLLSSHWKKIQNQVAENILSLCKIVKTLKAYLKKYLQKMRLYNCIFSLWVIAFSSEECKSRIHFILFKEFCPKNNQS